MNKPLQIFLAEDNPGDVELVRMALKAHRVDYRLALAKDGSEARSYIERMGTEPDVPYPDCILLDLNLPNTSGFELFARFREHPQCEKTPVIVVTSSNGDKDREQARGLGAARYFRKPSDLDEFLKLGAVIREVASEQGE